MTNILVLCTGNSCRSQIAHAYLEHFTDAQKVKVYSAGITTHGVNPRAIETMRKDGIDISKHTSNNVVEYENIDFEYVLTVCDNANEHCPIWVGRANKFHHNFPDPPKFVGTEDEIVAEFARVRDMIKEYVRDFVTTHQL
ncbi:protein-tyrosine-phosphatase [Emticicia aquatilis]|uniref:Protein-tyrosine-phosphatase n=1 Tax=Emticicia aquatilis TaxID=1537369 RepID=A0A916YTE6_9BACT|nr:arsenate reductase ArsC [Emticicia aquatilis]GGD59718.1 protein-tyrosine-phosphatase [Emticicia aquatilis]